MAWVFVGMDTSNGGFSFPRDGTIFYQLNDPYYKSSAFGNQGGYVAELKHWDQSKGRWITDTYEYSGGNFYVNGLYKYYTLRRLSIHNGIWGSKWTDGNGGVYYTLRFEGRLYRQSDYGIRGPLKRLPAGTKIHVASGYGYTPSSSYPKNSLIRITGYYEGGTYKSTQLYLDEPTKGYYPSSYNINLP
ncbi:hypothetical protein ERJ70_18680 [Sediminibacillus dalangtanensis]|uniref:Uncharacterized protein n=1 Tax=Sediminibacillus dalangtanensis TaxID=2729421 RepID=A0ABX7VVY6_9BACI|nr:hypothetical protein [Sediminibacillus dalangtanensis]QTN01133.1 hypothetical protein ERJ70_18680 [Sediminibacillus dalangtanensis]